jgi:hypothetical protein
MMMSMLESGGIAAVTDGSRRPDKDNPKGYYELEKVKEIQQDISWLEDCHGKAVKIVSNLLFYLPDNHKYKIIFMRRHMKEVLASQQTMLSRLERHGARKRSELMAESFSKHITRVEKWLKVKHYDVLPIDYRDVIIDPRKNSENISKFLNIRLNIAKMVAVVDSSLYRNRGDGEKKA